MIRISLRQLEYFQALAENLHFGRAAKYCGVTQPALSAQIAELEGLLETRLFHRKRGGVALTDDGRHLILHADRVLSEARELENRARRNQRVMEGRFRLGIIPTIAPYLLPSLLPRLRLDHPALEIELREATTPVLVELLKEADLDGIIAAEPISEPNFISLPLIVEEFLLAVSALDPDFIAPPVAPDDPALERLMLLEEGHCLRDQALAICGQVRPVAMARFGATSLTTLMEMVANGLGVTLIPALAMPSASTIKGLKVVPFQAPIPTRSLALFHRRNGTRQQECKNLAKTIRDVLADQPNLSR